MAVTLTANYREIFQPETVAKIDSLVEGNEFELDPILEFIDEHSETDFVSYYEEYVESGEEYGYEVVDAFLTLYDFDELGRIGDSYYGCYHSPAGFAEEYFENEVYNLNPCIVVDWGETAEFLLQHDFDRVDDHYFRCI